MCYATGSTPCSEECDEAGCCLLSSESKKVRYAEEPDENGRIAVYFNIEEQWEHKGWLMPTIT